MATFVLIHGAGDTGWYWHLTEAELQARGHHTIAPDLPCDNDTASLDDYAATVAGAAAGRQDLVIVGQSYGAFTATLAASQLPARLLVLLAGMIPIPGESPGQWWASTGYRQAAEGRARGILGGLGYDLATRCVAGRAHQVHLVQGRPVLPRRLLAAAGTTAPGHHPGRSSRLPLRRAQPPQGTQRPSRELPRLTGDPAAAHSRCTTCPAPHSSHPGGCTTEL